VAIVIRRQSNPIRTNLLQFPLGILIDLRGNAFNNTTFFGRKFLVLFITQNASRVQVSCPWFWRSWQVCPYGSIRTRDLCREGMWSYLLFAFFWIILTYLCSMTPPLKIPTGLFQSICSGCFSDPHFL
jgi:hypothetical protein